jgi:geranylgeranylglycerol-phosphate geranylgeranyltransferase
VNPESSDLENSKSTHELLPRFANSAFQIVKSEVRVLIFVWAITVSYLVASKLQPDRVTLVLLPFAGYFLALGIYVLSDAADIEDDRTNSPNRPLPSGRATKREAEILAVTAIAASFILAMFIGYSTTALFLVFLFLGLSYSIPRVNVKKRFPLKVVVPATGAAVFSLAGGAAAQGLRPIIFFPAIAFSLFGLVTLLIGDISDLKGDLAAGVRSFPIVIGAKNSVLFVMMIPFVLNALGIALYFTAQLNIAFPILLITTSAYCYITMRPLLLESGNPSVCRKVKSKMRIVHFVIQLIFILGIITV